MPNATDRPIFDVYCLTDDEVLQRAEEIYAERMQRYGVMTRPEDAADYFRAKLAHRQHEEFHVLFLDQRHCILGCELLARGTLNGTDVYPREVAKRALLLNAAAIVCAHNHPSGDPEPSAADRAFTQRLMGALRLFDIRLLDHIVVGAKGAVSLAARGWT